VKGSPRNRTRLKGWDWPRSKKANSVNGRWVPGRGLNGDETPDWRGLWFPGDRYTIQRVKLYRYRRSAAAGGSLPPPASPRSL